jgi:hypothetical protein
MFLRANFVDTFRVEEVIAIRRQAMLPQSGVKFTPLIRWERCATFSYFFPSSRIQQSAAFSIGINSECKSFPAGGRNNWMEIRPLPRICRHKTIRDNGKCDKFLCLQKDKNKLSEKI